MARILELFLDKKTNQACGDYPTHEALFNALAKEETMSIACLSSKVSGAIFKVGKKHGLNDDDIEELICDCITVFLQKVKTGMYVFQGHSPSTFVIEIAKNKALNYRRNAQKHQTADLPDLSEWPSEQDFTSAESTALLENLLAQLDTNCQNLIRLKYLEEWRDKDLIEQKLTQYTTVDALKNNRARCMKKLIAMANQGM